MCFRETCLFPATGAYWTRTAIDTCFHGVYANDTLIGKDIVFVRAAGRELRDHGPFRSRLKPVERVGHERVLLAGIQVDIVPNRVVLFLTVRKSRLRRQSARSRHIQIDISPTATERFLLAGIAFHAGMTVFRASLPRPHRQFLRAASCRVYINEYG